MAGDYGLTWAECMCNNSPPREVQGLAAVSSDWLVQTYAPNWVLRVLWLSTNRHLVLMQK